MKLIKAITLLFLAAVLFAGCAENSGKVEDTTDTVVSTENADTEDITVAEPDDGTNGSGMLLKINDKKIRILEIKKDSEDTVENDYKLEWNLSDILDDDNIAEGSFYYFSRGTESNVPWEEWVKKEGSYTTMELFFDMTNLDRNAEVPYTERGRGVVVYNYPDDIDLSGLDNNYIDYLKSVSAEYDGMEVFDFTMMQENPDQTDNEGYPAISLDGVVLEYEQSARCRMIADVSSEFYQSWEDENAVENMYAVFDFGADSIYFVNLREYLEASSAVS